MIQMTEDWEVLHTFLAVLRTGSLSAAARQMSTAQPTVRRRIAALEHKAGTALFVRSPTGLAPTERAMALATHAEAMEVAAAAFARTAASSGEAIEGIVRLTASEIVGGEVLPSMLAALQQTHPALRFELVLSNQTQDLLRQEADIAVRMVRPKQSALVMKYVGKVQLGLFATPQYLAAHSEPKTLDDLGALTMIGPDRTASEHRAIIDVLGPHAAQALTYRTDSHLAQLSAIRAGVGVGICQIPLAKREPQLVRVLSDAFEIPLDTWITMHEDLRRVPRIRTVFDYLSESMAAYCRDV